ncbi:Rad9 protein [Cardiosporidium cionae]|uniref:Rad9 protein n=1 Tax=Cardiosporidium cionae TaxID=476202 RepID=A0ABQ7JFY9_9APIC|nr:Rad9 protein [Cardiosporidium cionae]|eukprot:KAF8822894.1 Rad9 protein [Cardiosporidium cionae]
MQAEIGYPQTAIFRSILTSFRSVNRFVHISPGPEFVHLSSFSPSRTCWLQVTLYRNFFSNFISGPNAVNPQEINTTTAQGSDTRSNDRHDGCVTIPLKPLLRTLAKISPYSASVHKRRERLEGMVGKGRLMIDKIIFHDQPDRNTFLFKIVFKEFGCVQLLTFSYEENQFVVPQKISWKLRHSLRILPQTLTKVLDMYCPNSDDISLIPDAIEQTVRLQTPTSDMQPQPPLNTQEQIAMPHAKNNFGEIMLDRVHFLEAHFSKDLPNQRNLTFSAREFRSVVALCDAVDAPFNMTFCTPGMPIIVSFGKSVDYLIYENTFSPAMANAESINLRPSERDDATAWTGLLWTNTVPTLESVNESHRNEQTTTELFTSDQTASLPLENFTEDAACPQWSNEDPSRDEQHTSPVTLIQTITTGRSQSFLAGPPSISCADAQLLAYGYKGEPLIQEWLLKDLVEDNHSADETIDAELVDLSPESDIMDDDWFDMMNLWSNQVNENSQQNSKEKTLYLFHGNYFATILV